MKNNPKEFYTNNITKYEAALTVARKALLISSALRFTFFIAAALGAYFSYPNGRLVVLSLVFGIVAFLVLVTRHSRLDYKKRKIQKLLELNKAELAVLSGDYQKMDTGTEFVDPLHPYSNDIDLFGEDSFFQFVNRTVTGEGKVRLATLFKANVTGAIQSKQAAVKELSDKVAWRQEFSAIASLVNTTVSVNSIRNWIREYKTFIPPAFRFLPNVFFGITVALTGLYFLDVVSWHALVALFLVGLVITGTQFKNIERLYTHVNQIKDTFDQYHRLIALIETASFEAEFLKSQKEKVVFSGKKASLVLKEFSSILNAFDQRNNMLFGFAANGLLLWDVRQVQKIDTWLSENSENVEDWFSVIAFFDAYNSLGNYHFNHPDYIFPEIVASGPVIEGTGLGHPMISPDKCVTNDCTIDTAVFFIITGANMAGKSTFLRTVALQIVMSNCGMPICATTCKYKPMKLFSSMRTTDSLSEDASYFFSELTQLKRIVDALEKEPYFIILDEILKGTNSKDKAAGSKKFIEKLVKANATGIIATHDLSLCDLEAELPAVQNRYFDAQIIKDELYFDYTFKKGICQNMNASFLLNKMGITS